MASEWEVLDEVSVLHNAPADDEGRREEFVLQRLRVAETDAIEFRFGHRYLHADGRTQWIPNSPRIPPEELVELTCAAAEKGWITTDMVRRVVASARPLAAASLLSLRARVESWMQDVLSRVQDFRPQART